MNDRPSRKCLSDDGDAVDVKQLHENILQALKGVDPRLRLACRDRIGDVPPALFDDFLEFAAGYEGQNDRAMLIAFGATDRSRLEDFAQHFSIEEIKQRTLERYGVDVDALPDHLGCTILEAIRDREV